MHHDAAAIGSKAEIGKGSAANVRLLLTVSVPAVPLLVPGEIVPPARTETGPLMTPMPANVPPATVTVLVLSEPLTCKVPLLMVVAPVFVQMPLSASVPVPALTSAVGPEPSSVIRPLKAESRFSAPMT